MKEIKMPNYIKSKYWELREKLNNTLHQAVASITGEITRSRIEYIRISEKTSVASKVGQLALAQEWKRRMHNGEKLPALNEVEFRNFSQNGEDGILLYIFSLIGTTNKFCVELCAGDGIECNSANLILNHSWTGLLVDGKTENVIKGKQFYASHPDTFSFPPQFAHAWVDRESINDLLAKHGITGEIDLLSIDLDGVDYWIWDAIETIQPRVVVAETQCIWGAERSVTVPYSREFSSPLIQGFGVYSGASLPAFVKLAKRKGYRLVGTQALGFNAFFVREGLGVDELPEVSAEFCLDRPFVKWATRELLPLVKDKEWVEV